MREFNKEAHRYVLDAIYMMLEDEPFFAHIALGVKWVQDSKLENPSITTDGLTITYNPDAILNMVNVVADANPLAMMNLRNAVGAVCLKIALRHAFRAAYYPMEDENKAAMASDGAAILVAQNLFRGGLWSSMLSDDWMSRILKEKLSFEQIYEVLPKHPSKQKEKKGPGQPAQSGLQKPGDGMKPGDGKSAPHSAHGHPQASGGGEEGDGGGQGEAPDMGDMEHEAKKLAAGAAEKARKAGKMPGELQRAYDESYRGRKDWRDEVRKFLGGGEIPAQSWSKPNRRYIADGVYLPGMPKEGPGVVVLAIDTSGSIDDTLLTKFIAEVRKINVDMQPECIHVVCCDARVQWTGEFGPYDDVKAEPKGRGGTAFSPVFNWVRERGINPKALMYFTDLECSDFGNKPEFPVLWICWPGGSQKRPPFGDVVRM